MKKAYMIYPNDTGKDQQVVLAGSFAAAALAAEELFPGSTCTSGVRSIEFLGQGREVKHEGDGAPCGGRLHRTDRRLSGRDSDGGGEGPEA